MATIYDVAKKANVSPMTVSRVINQKGQISEATRLKVEKAIQELNYIQNRSAKSLTTKTTKILSLLITDITNPFFTKVARGAEDKAMQLGYRVVLCNSDEDIHKESQYIQMLLETGVDGILITPSGDHSKKNMQTLIKHRMPFVLLDREIDEIRSDIILGNSQEGTRKLMEHLIKQGHKHIALINGPSHISTAREREKAYIESLQIAGLNIDEDLMFETEYKHEMEDNIIDQIVSLPAPKKPTAIFAANNFIAVRMIKSLRGKGVTVPGDMAIVCFDDFEPFGDLNPFLTVATQPAYDFGYMGIQMLVERIEGTAPKDYRKIVLPPNIMIRSSSAI